MNVLGDTAVGVHLVHNPDRFEVILLVKLTERKKKKGEKTGEKTGRKKKMGRTGEMASTHLLFHGILRQYYQRRHFTTSMNEALKMRDEVVNY